MSAYDWASLLTAASERVYAAAVCTPVDPLPRLSERLGCTVLLKREDRQPVFSFKLRGAYNKLAGLTAAQRAAGVICSSAGNHAQGVALAAGMLDTAATVVMPVTTPSIKVDAVRALGAEVVLQGDNYDAAQAHAHSLAEHRGLAFLHPFDDPEVIAGQATIGMELLDQVRPPPDALFVPVGGGGLAAGIAIAVRSAWPGTQLIGVEPDESASMRAALNAGAPVTLPEVGIFADGVAVKRVGDLTFAVCREHLDDLVTVSTDTTCAAIRDIFEDTRTVVEPAGALAVAAARDWAGIKGNSGRTALAVCCGANLNFDRLRHIAERAAIGEQREALFAVRIDERPGSFRDFCHALGTVQVTEFNYRRSDQQDARLFVGVELREGAREQAALLARLRSSGFTTMDLSGDELAQLHVRHLVGGPADVAGERLYRCEFPERPGALAAFLEALGSGLGHQPVSLPQPRLRLRPRPGGRATRAA